MQHLQNWNHTRHAFMCIHVAECPTFRGLLANCVSNMALVLGLDWGANAIKYYISQFTFQLVSMDVDSPNNTKSDLKCILVHFEVTHMFGGWHIGSELSFMCNLSWWLAPFSCDQ